MYSSSHNHGSSGKWDVSNISFLSFGVIFHFHDYGREGIFVYSLEVNHHLKNGGSFCMMINQYLKNGETRKPTYKKCWLDFQGIHNILQPKPWFFSTKSPSFLLGKVQHMRGKQRFSWTVWRGKLRFVVGSNWCGGRFWTDHYTQNSSINKNRPWNLNVLFLSQNISSWNIKWLIKKWYLTWFCYNVFLSLLQVVGKNNMFPNGGLMRFTDLPWLKETNPNKESSFLEIQK